MKMKNIFLSIICILLFPFTVLALEGNSGVVSTNNRVGEFSIGKMVFSNLSFTTFVNYNNTGIGGYEVGGVLHNYYNKDVEITAVLTLYDVNKNVLEVISNNYSIYANKDLYYLISNPINPSVKRFSIDSVRYYDVSVNVLTDVSEKKEKKKNNNYEIEQYDTLIDVTKENKIFYNEDITVKFKNDMPYFYRKIFINNKVPFYNNQLAKLTDISSSEKMTTSLEKGYKILKLSSKENYSDMKKFNIKYVYDLGNDYSKKNDKLYINIFDNTFDVILENTNFEITLPEEIGDKKITFVSLKDDITKKVSYEIIGNKIKGSYSNLGANKNLGLLIDLEDGYFNESNSIIDKSLYLMIFGPIILMIVSLFLTFLLLKRKKVNKRIKVDKLMKLNSLEVSYIYNDKITNKDIVILLVELANEGYIKFKEMENDTFEIIRLKKYKGNDEIKNILMDSIFKEQNKLTENDLYNSNCNVLEEVKKYNKSLVTIYNNYFNKFIYLLIFAILIFGFITFKPLIMYDEDSIIIGTLLSIICLILGIIFLLSKYSLLEKFLVIMCVSIFWIVVMYVYLIPSLLIHPIYLISYILGLLIVIGLLYLYKNVPKRTFYADKELANIERFKIILEKNSLKSLNKILKMDDCYMNGWSYANVLGLSSEWQKKIDDNVILPEWFDFNNVNSQNFNKKLNDVISRITYALCNYNDSKGNG